MIEKDNKNELDKYTHLSEVQKLILEIFKEVLKFCEKEEIEYFILGGTLLGSIRHQGFIPWDDDIDIGIPRPMYEKFLATIGEALPEHLELKTYNNSNSHHYYFGRVVDNRYSLKRTGSKVQRNEDIWVDIFPLDGMPNNKVLREYHKMRLLFTRALYHISCFEKVNLMRPNRPLSEKIVIKFILITNFGTKLDTHKILNKLDRLLKKYPLNSSQYIVNFMGQYKFKEMFNKKLYYPVKKYNFEDLLLSGPQDFQRVLSQMYGDYMTPPKESDRNAHAAEFNN